MVNKIYDISKVLNTPFTFENFGCNQGNTSVSNQSGDVVTNRFNSKIPAPDICMGPKCILPEINSNNDQVITINSSLHMSCPPNAEEEEDQCLHNIYQSYGKGNIYQTNLLGLPTTSGSTSPPNQIELYDRNYDTYKNKKVNDNISEMTNKPDTDAFELSDQCLDWCNKSSSCNAVSYKLNDGTVNSENSGQALCKYYDDVQKENLKTAQRNTVAVKRVSKYIPLPSKQDRNISWFNMNKPRQLSDNEAKARINKRATCSKRVTETFETPRTIKYGETIYFTNLYSPVTYMTTCGPLIYSCFCLIVA